MPHPSQFGLHAVGDGIAMCQNQYGLASAPPAFVPDGLSLNQRLALRDYKDSHALALIQFVYASDQPVHEEQTPSQPKYGACITTINGMIFVSRTMVRSQWQTS